MNKLFVTLLSVIVSTVSWAQGPTVDFNFNPACQGATITASLEMPEFELQSSALRDNQQNGVMFDVVGNEGAIITGFMVDVDQVGTDFEIYYRTGSYVGFENSNAGWDLLGSSSGIGTGLVNTGVDFELEILPGQTLGFYITTTDASTEFIGYADGTAVGTELASNVYLTVNSGVGKSYPFGTTYSPRDFVGAVLYEPIPSDIIWADNLSTGLTADYTVTRTRAVTASMTYGGFIQKAAGVIQVNSYEAMPTAVPAVLGWGESSTLTANVTQSTGLATTFIGGNFQSGAMFDISATNALEINGFSVFPVAEFSTSASVEIFYKTGTFVGSEGNADAWTSIGTATGLPVEEESYVALTAPLSVAPGQTMGILITRTDADGHLYYTNAGAVGDVYSSDANLTVKVGTGILYPFAASYTQRMLNTIVHYEIENPVGLNYSWAPEGGTGGAAVVTPNANVTYTVTVDDGVCDGSGDVDVTMAVGVEEVLAERFSIYPNPATDELTVLADRPMDVQRIALLDLGGRVVFELVPNGTFNQATVPVGQLAKGIYLLQMSVENVLINHKVAVR